MADTTDQAGGVAERAAERFAETRDEFERLMATLGRAAADARAQKDEDLAEALDEALESLEEANLLDAVEGALALDEDGVEEAALVAQAVASYCAPSLTVAGGNGESLETAILFEGAESGEDAVAGCYHYMDALFGTEDGAWRVRRCVVVQVGSGAYDVVEAVTASGETRVLFFAAGELEGEPTTDLRELGTLVWPTDDGEPDVEIDKTLPEDMVAMVMGHLMLHASMDMVRT
ncbi:MAG: hypothetical protein AB7H88_19460 [Vicinamibacterales bacterium]